MKLEILNKGIADLYKAEGNYKLDYGTKRYAQDISTKLKVETDKKLTFHPTCGCTTSNQEKTETGYDLTLIYDSKRKGNFSKVVKVMSGRTLVSEITLKGTII